MVLSKLNNRKVIILKNIINVSLEEIIKEDVTLILKKLLIQIHNFENYGNLDYQLLMKNDSVEMKVKVFVGKEFL